MIELQHDLWEVECDVRCITTNGIVTAAGTNIMGGGCAREAVERYPDVPWTLGALLKEHGNHVYLLGPKLVSFPTIEHRLGRATRQRILTSTYELLSLTKLYGWKKVALPRPGAGLGGLNYERVVRPLLSGLLDDRFLIVDFPRAPVANEWACCGGPQHTVADVTDYNAPGWGHSVGCPNRRQAVTA